MTDAAQTAQTLAAVKAIKDAAGKVETQLKADFLDAHGRGTLYPTVDGVGELATVTVSKGTASRPYVRDEAAFLAWVKANRPGAIVEQVRASDRDSILKGCLTTGEMPDGVDMTEPGRPTVTVKQSAEQARATVAAWQSGAITVPSLLAVEGGGS